MKHNDSARIGSLSKWHTFELTGAREGRGGGGEIYIYIYTIYMYMNILLLIVAKFSVVIIQYPERCYGTTPDAR